MKIINTLLGDLLAIGNNKVLLNGGMDSSANSHTSHLNSMRNKTMVVFNELKNTKFDTSSVKALVGCEKVNARQLNKEEESFKLFMKLFILTNAIPEMDEMDPAFLRRVAVIQFLITFDPKKKREKFYRKGDPNISDRLQENLSGFLEFFLQGGVRYYKEGFEDIPECVQSVKDEYVEEQDVVGDFVNKCLVPTTSVKEGSISGADLFGLFKQFTSVQCINSDSYKVTKFGKVIKKILAFKKTNTGVKYLCKEKPVEEVYESDNSEDSSHSSNSSDDDID